MIDRDADFLHNRDQARMRAAIPLLSSVCFLLPPTVAVADETAARAVIEKRCLACHGPARMSDLDLRVREAMLKGGKRADSGGSNAARNRAWKYYLQQSATRPGWRS